MSTAGIGNLTTLIKRCVDDAAHGLTYRLEAATSRLEDISMAQFDPAPAPTDTMATTVPGSAPLKKESAPLPPTVAAWDNEIVPMIVQFRAMSQAIGSLVEEQVCRRPARTDTG